MRFSRSIVWASVITWTKTLHFGNSRLAMALKRSRCAWSGSVPASRTAFSAHKFLIRCCVLKCRSTQTARWRRDEAERMAAESVHAAVAVGGSAVAEQHRHLMQRLGCCAPEAPHHGRRLEVCLRVALLHVHEVGELDRVLDEIHRRVVADQVPVAVLGVEADGEAARVALDVRRPALAADGGRAGEGLGRLADGAEPRGLRVLADVVGVTANVPSAAEPLAWTTRSAMP